MKLKDIFQYLLAGITVIGWFYLFNRLFISTLPVANEKLAGIMFGSLSTIVVMVYSYFFGTNKESAAKTEMLYNSTPIVPTVDVDNKDKSKEPTV